MCPLFCFRTFLLFVTTLLFCSLASAAAGPCQSCHQTGKSDNSAAAVAQGFRASDKNSAAIAWLTLIDNDVAVKSTQLLSRLAAKTLPAYLQTRMAALHLPNSHGNPIGTAFGTPALFLM